MTNDMKLVITEFDELVRKTWEKGMKEDNLKYKTYKSVKGVDKGIPFEARYLPSLEEKSTEEEDNKDDDDDDDKDSNDDKKNGKTENNSEKHDAEEEKGALLRVPREIPLGHIDAEEERGVDHRYHHDSSVRLQDSYINHGVDPDEDPFAPPQENVITRIDSEFTAMLNKYSLEKGHFLVVTNHFVPQKGIVRPQDLVVLHDIVQKPGQRSYAFLNGGPDAGASQEHRHFQIMEVPDLGKPVWPDVTYNQNPKSTEPLSHPDLPVANFLLPILDSSRDGLVKSFSRLFKLAQQAAGTDDDEMPFNFLMMKEYMMVFPRRNNNWHEEVGIGGTCQVGSIPVEDTDHIDDVMKAGLVEILRHIGFPKN